MTVKAGTSPATVVAWTFAAGVSTNPLSCTVSLYVLTLMSKTLSISSLAMAAFTFVVIAALSIY